MLPDVTFTNNIGSLSFKRCLVGFTDLYTWNGSAVTAIKNITIAGTLLRGTDSIQDTEMYEAVIDGIIGDDNASLQDVTAKPGTLVLPWTTLQEVQLQRITTNDDVWLDSVQVEAVFTDESPDRNRYTLSFFDLKIHNPRVSLPTLTRPVTDRFIHMPMTTSSVNAPISMNDIAFGPVRTHLPREMMDLRVSGSLYIDEIPGLDGGTFVAASSLEPNEVNKRINFLIDTLSQRRGSSTITTNDPNGSQGPIGYPREFDIADAIPELTGEIPIRKLYVADSIANWAVEDGMIDVGIVMRMQPQEWH